MKEKFNLATFFYDVAKHNKNNSALAYRDKIITYDELNRLSNKLANHFLSIDIKLNDVIGIFNTKEPLGYASMLACLKIGAIYTNIDEENPPQRLKKILQTCKPKLLVSDHKLSNILAETISTLNLKIIDFTKIRPI